jgi:hypothetical protein
MGLEESFNIDAYYMDLDYELSKLASASKGVCNADLKEFLRRSTFRQRMSVSMTSRFASSFQMYFLCSLLKTGALKRKA